MGSGGAGAREPGAGGGGTALMEGSRARGARGPAGGNARGGIRTPDTRIMIPLL